MYFQDTPPDKWNFYSYYQDCLKQGDLKNFQNESRRLKKDLVELSIRLDGAVKSAALALLVICKVVWLPFYFPVVLVRSTRTRCVTTRIISRSDPCPAHTSRYRLRISFFGYVLSSYYRISNANTFLNINLKGSSS